MNAIIHIANSLLENLKQNESLILEKKIRHSALLEVQTFVKDVLITMQKNISSIHFSNKEKIESAQTSISFIINTIDSSAKLSNDELIKLESTQEGMKKALHAVKELGENIENNEKQKNDE